MNEWWRDELQKRREAGLHRALKMLPPDVLDLSSNDYLGLARHPEVIEAACRATTRYGAGARASRLVAGHFEIHAELEAKLAAFKKSEAALLFPSGYHANLAVITALSRSGDTIFCDKRNHASLIDACFLARAHGTTVRFYDSIEKLAELLQKNSGTSQLIVSDAVFSMDGDLAPIPELLKLANAFGALLILDDAHGTGVLGESGRGAVEYSSLLPHFSSLVQIGTLSKALGSQGGFVVGDKSLIEWLVNAARPFIYTTGLAPAACGAALASLSIIEREPHRLRRLQAVKSHLAEELETLGFAVREQPSPILPIIVGEAQEALLLSEKLLERGIWCPAIRPPTVPQNSSRLRVTANGELNEKDLTRILTAFAECV